MKLTQRQRLLLESVDNFIGGFPIRCMADHARRRTRALQQRGLIRKHKTIAVLTKAGKLALSSTDRKLSENTTKGEP